MTPLQLAIKEIDSIAVQFKDPTQELFLRYLQKDEADREAFVMALAGNIITLHRRLQATWK